MSCYKIKTLIFLLVSIYRNNYIAYYDRTIDPFCLLPKTPPSNIKRNLQMPTCILNINKDSYLLVRLGEQQWPEQTTKRQKPLYGC